MANTHKMFVILLRLIVFHGFINQKKCVNCAVI